MATLCLQPTEQTAAAQLKEAGACSGTGLQPQNFLIVDGEVLMALRTVLLFYNRCLYFNRNGKALRLRAERGTAWLRRVYILKR